jgi:hypothetical protein
MAPVPSVESHNLRWCQRLAPVSGDTATVTHEVHRKANTSAPTSELAGKTSARAYPPRTRATTSSTAGAPVGDGRLDTRTARYSATRPANRAKLPVSRRKRRTSAS